MSINGDGGFMYTVKEMSTAAQHGIGVVAVVFSDGAYGNVKRIQQQASTAAPSPATCSIRTS